VKSRLANAFAVLIAILTASAVSTYTQVTAPTPLELFPDNRPRREQPKSIEDTLAKLQIEKSKKEHEELLERGEEAARIIEKIETNYAKTSAFSSKDREDLDRLEKVVRKIRNDLGGDSDDKAANELEREIASDSTEGGAFKYLKDATTKLVAELKRSTRYSISAVAIQASNGVITIARFLRLRK
jgi:hypothetical protein